MLVRKIDFQRYLLTLRVLLSLLLCAAVAFYVQKSIRWQVMGDTSIMHYINFMMSRGLAPYRDIIDINLPGSYFMEGLAMHIFGGGNLGWRLYDFTLLAILTASLIVIAWPHEWFAGLFAGVLFIAIHAAQGPGNAGQREQLMITLIIVGYALLFTALRRRKPLLLLPFGLLFGIAASLKPTSAPLGILLLSMCAISLKKRNLKMTSYVVQGVIGGLLGVITSLAFLYKYHAFAAFVEIFRRLAPYYAGVGNASLSSLLSTLFRPKYYFLIILGAALALYNRAEKDWENWERSALGLGILFGIASYVAQGKPYDHHAYSFVVFVLIWSSIEFGKVWNKEAWIHLLGLAFFSLGVLYQVPFLVTHIVTYETWSAENDAMKADLTRLGGDNLQYQVQCFDMVSSCFATLYRMQLMPYTTYMGDYMFFGPQGRTPIIYYRNMMWAKINKDPPQVVVVTNNWCCVAQSLAELNQWPQLAAFLESEYIQEPTRTFGDYAYRIYVSKAHTASLASTKQAAPSLSVASPIPGP